MAIQLNDNIRVAAGKPSEAKYLNLSNAPYTGTSQVFSQVPVPERHVGLTVNVNNIEYWFATGVTNGNLVTKTSSGSSSTTANNGLTKVGNNVRLGGALTGNTDITAGGLYNLNLGTAASRLNQFNVDADNIVRLKRTTGNQRNEFYFLGSDVGLEIEDTAFGTFNAVYLSQSNVALYSSEASNSIMFSLEPNISSGNQISVNGSASFKGLVYEEDYAANYTPRSLVDKGYVTGLTSSLGVTANNGLTKVGSNVRLGGTLTGNTLIDSNAKQLIFDIETTGSTFLRGTVGSDQDISLFRFKNQSGNNASARLLDVHLGSNNGNASANGAGNLTFGQSNLTGTTAGATEFSGGRNIAIGFSNITGATSTSSHYIGIGRRNGNSRVGHSSYSVGIGYENANRSINSVAGANDSHVAIGVYNMVGMTATTSSSTNLVAIGASVMQNSIVRNGGSVGVGSSSLSSGDFGSSNIGIGNQAAALLTGGTATQFNVAVGTLAFRNGAGAKNTFIGSEAGSTKVTGSQNTGIGVWSLPNTNGSNNSGLGTFAGYHASLKLSGSFNSFVGYQSSYGVSGLTNTIVIGNNLNATISNRIYLGNSTQIAVLGSAISGSTSPNVVVRNHTTKELETRTIASLISGATITANNGLTKTGNNIYLGGALTGNTSITGGGSSNLALGTDASKLNDFTVSVDNFLAIKSDNGSLRNELAYYGTDIILELEAEGGDVLNALYLSETQTQLRAADNSTGSTSILFSMIPSTNRIVVDGNTSFRGIVYNENYAANYTPRTLVDKAYVDAAITGATPVIIGDIVTGVTFTASTETSFIGVSGTSESTIWLPAIPTPFKQYIVSDIAGNGLSVNINIDGNGYLIQGASAALIDTDYGSITFIYNGFNWSVVSVV